MKFSEMEREVIALKAINETIDSMINRGLLELYGSDPTTNILFHSAIHQKFFNIMLVDFLSTLDERLAGTKEPSLSLLTKICDKPEFNLEESIARLRDSVKELKDWLETEVTIEAWLPSIDRNLDLKILRSEFLRICGNISKHSFARLTKTASELLSILKRNGAAIDEQDSLLILDDFYQRFHLDILNYHGTTLCELLNNIRWVIHDYLLPQYNLSMKPDASDPIKYEYKIPNEITTKFGRMCYWDLMNGIRRGPYVRKFTGSKWLKLRY